MKTVMYHLPSFNLTSAYWYHALKAQCKSLRLHLYCSRIVGKATFTPPTPGSSRLRAWQLVPRTSKVAELSPVRALFHWRPPPTSFRVFINCSYEAEVPRTRVLSVPEGG